MATKKQTLRRITLLYIIFFAVISISLVLSFTSSAFSESFNTGRNDYRRTVDNILAKDKVQIFYDLSTMTSHMDFDIPVYASAEDSLIIKARPSVMDIEAVSPKGEGIEGSAFAMLCVLAAMLTYAAIFVVIFMILHSLRRSILTGEMFHRSNIARTRLTGILLICGSLLISLNSWLESRAAAPYFEGGPMTVNTAFPFNFTELIIGVLIFVVAEVFAIGYSVSQEQKFTI